MLARIVALHSLNYVEGQTILTEKKAHENGSRVSCSE